MAWIDMRENDTSECEKIIPSAGVILGADGSRSSIILQQRRECKHYSSPVTTITRTSLTTTSSSTSSWSHINANSGSNDVGSDYDCNVYPDEIFITIRKKTSSQKEVGNVKSAPQIPFLDYLEEQVRELSEKNNSASKSIDMRSPQRNRDSINITHQELSPLSYRSAAAAEAETIRRLRREVFGLYVTLDALKKNSKEWVFLNSKLQVAREELNAVLEDQKVVRSIRRGNRASHKTL
jgi:hypothetical protein